VNELAVLGRAAGGGAVVAVTTAMASDADLERIARLRRRFPILIVVSIDVTGGDAAGRGVNGRSMPGPVIPVTVTTRRPFATAWTESLGRDRRLAGSVGWRS
jgi:hypothetical protein